MAGNYYGVTHPSLPNYVAAISGNTWGANDDVPTRTFDHTNLVDQLEASHLTWGAYMDTMPSAGFTGGSTRPTPRCTSTSTTHSCSSTTSRRTRRGSPRSSRTPISPTTSIRPCPNFVWISPNQCNDMHGGVYAPVAGHPETPCPYGSAEDDVNDAALKAKADAFVHQAVDTIMHSKAWTGNSAIFIATDENDFDASNPGIDNWESAAGCCDSPILPNGFPFLGSNGARWPHARVPGRRDVVRVRRWPDPSHRRDDPRQARLRLGHAYNHYSLLRTIEDNWHLGYLGNASDSAQVTSMTEFFAR